MGPYCASNTGCRAWDKPHTFSGLQSPTLLNAGTGPDAPSGVFLGVLDSTCVSESPTYWSRVFYFAAQLASGKPSISSKSQLAQSSVTWAVPGLSQSDRLQSDTETSLVAGTGKALPSAAASGRWPIPCVWLAAEKEHDEQVCCPWGKTMGMLSWVLNEPQTKLPFVNGFIRIHTPTTLTVSMRN